MGLQSEMIAEVQHGASPDGVALTIIFREIKDERETYWVAECVEIPGCVSQGSTREEAEANIGDAMRACLSVLFEDCMKRVAASHELPSLLGISSQKKLRVDTTPQLEYA